MLLLFADLVKSLPCLHVPCAVRYSHIWLFICARDIPTYPILRPFFSIPQGAFLGCASKIHSLPLTTLRQPTPQIGPRAPPLHTGVALAPIEIVVERQNVGLWALAVGTGKLPLLRGVSVAVFRELRLVGWTQWC